MLTAFQLATLAALRGQNANAPAAVKNYFEPRPPPITDPVPQWQQGPVAAPPPVVTVNPLIASALGPVPQAPPAQAPSLRVAHPGPQAVPQAQMAESGNAPQQGPSSQSKDASVGLSVAPLQYGVVNTPGSPGGEVDMVGPKAHRIELAATNMRSDAAQDMAHANAVAVANEAALYPERAKYYAELAEKESRDQGGRNEQNRQRMEDLDRETKELRDMKVDPMRRMKSGMGIFDMLAAGLGSVGQAYLAKAGINSENIGAHLAQANAARDLSMQEGDIANRRSYVDQVRQAMREQREAQGDQVASNQRGAQLSNASFEAQVRQAMLEGQAGKDIATGNAQSADQMAARMDQNASRIRNFQPTGGGQVMTWKDPATGVQMQGTRKEFQAYVTEASKDIRGAGLGIARDTAKVDAEGKGKKEEDMSKRWVPRADLPQGGYSTTTADEAKEHREADLADAQFKQTVQKLKEMRNKLGAADVSGLNTEDARALKSLQAQAVVQFGKANKLGSFDDGLKRLAEDVFGDPTGLRSPIPQYDTIVERVDAAAATRARAGQGYMRPNMPSSFKPAGK